MVGERSNGKTYAVKERIIDRVRSEPGFKFIYIRRRQEQITRKIMKKLFTDISEYAEEKLGDVIQYSTEQGFFYVDPLTECAVTIG